MEKNLTIKFDEDDVILAQGCMKGEMYKIIYGKVAVYISYGKKEEYLIGILSEQRCFGELSILCHKPSVYTVVALEEVLVLRITEDTFDEFIKNNSRNVIEIMKNLANTVDTLSLNLNLLNEDMAAFCNGKNNLGKKQEIAHMMKQYATINSVYKELFSASV